MNRDFFGDETIEAERIFINGFTDKEFNYPEALLVAKYIRGKQGVGDARLKTLIIEYCEKNGLYFNYVRNRDVINSIVRDSRKPFYKKREPIIITENEMTTIRSIKSFVSQKILFGMLVFSKKNGGFFNKKDFSDLKKALSIRLTHQEIMKKHVFVFQKSGFLRDSNQNLFLMFLSSDKPAIVFSTQKQIYKIGEIYKDYCGGELGYCRDCNAEFLKNGNRHNYCDIHSGEHMLERHKKYNKKRNFA